MSALLELVDHLLETDPNIDASRVYLTGLSRGGQGVWNAALQRPDFFAAIVPISSRRQTFGKFAYLDISW